MNYLLDENLPHRLAVAIDALHGRDNPGSQVVSVRDRAWDGYVDRRWIMHLAQSGKKWSILTRDRMRSEVDILSQPNLTWVILHRAWGSMPYRDLAWKMIRAWPEIAEQTNSEPSRIYRLRASGKLVVDR